MTGGGSFDILGSIKDKLPVQPEPTLESGGGASGGGKARRIEVRVEDEPSVDFDAAFHLIFTVEFENELRSVLRKNRKPDNKDAITQEAIAALEEVLRESFNPEAIKESGINISSLDELVGYMAQSSADHKFLFDMNPDKEEGKKAYEISEGEQKKIAGVIKKYASKLIPEIVEDHKEELIREQKRSFDGLSARIVGLTKRELRWQINRILNWEVLRGKGVQVEVGSAALNYYTEKIINDTQDADIKSVVDYMVEQKKKNVERVKLDETQNNALKEKLNSFMHGYADEEYEIIDRSAKARDKKNPAAKDDASSPEKSSHPEGKEKETQEPLKDLKLAAEKAGEKIEDIDKNKFADLGVTYRENKIYDADIRLHIESLKEKNGLPAPEIQTHEEARKLFAQFSDVIHKINTSTNKRFVVYDNNTYEILEGNEQGVAAPPEAVASEGMPTSQESELDREERETRESFWKIGKNSRREIITRLLSFHDLVLKQAKSPEYIWADDDEMYGEIESECREHAKKLLEMFCHGLFNKREVERLAKHMSELGAGLTDELYATENIKE